VKKHVHARIISLRGGLGPLTSLTPPLFIEVPVPRQKSEWSCICVLGVWHFTFFILSLIIDRIWIWIALYFEYMNGYRFHAEGMEKCLKLLRYHVLYQKNNPPLYTWHDIPPNALVLFVLYTCICVHVCVQTFQRLNHFLYISIKLNYVSLIDCPCLRNIGHGIIQVL
jgi:hypothetical protein